MISEVVRRMKDAGAPLEAIMIAIEAIEAIQGMADETNAKARDAKLKDRDRKRLSRSVRGQSVDSPWTVHGNGADCPETDPTPSAPQRDIIKPPTNPTPFELRSNALREAFDLFWDLFPNKVGKVGAERSFAKLWREMAGSVEPIMAGLEFYIGDKPADRPWLNPATFLNQRRFEDKPSHPQPRAGPSGSRPMTVSEMAHLDDERYFDEPRPDPFRRTDQSATAADKGRGGFAGRLPFEDHPKAGRLVDH